MAKTTLGSKVAELRAERSLTMADIGKLCDISEASYWKVEHDRSIRWETVHLISVVAFKLKPASDQYQALHALWLKNRQTMAESQTPDFATSKLSKHAIEAGRKFRILIRDLDETQTRKVLSAATRSARSLL